MENNVEQPEYNTEIKHTEKNQESKDIERSFEQRASENLDLRESANSRCEIENKDVFKINSSFNNIDPLIDYSDNQLKGEVGEMLAERALNSEYGLKFEKLHDIKPEWEGRFCDRIAQDNDGMLITAEVKYWKDIEGAANEAYEQLQNTYEKMPEDIKEMVFVYIDQAENVCLYKFSSEDFISFKDARDFKDFIINNPPNIKYKFQ